jgi:hypothetical protein
MVTVKELHAKEMGTLQEDMEKNLPRLAAASVER